MRVRNNENFNVSCNTGHAGGAKFMNIPAGATIELEDSEWSKYAKSAEGMLGNGILEITKAVSLTAEEEEARNAAQLEEAQKLIDASKATDGAPKVDAKDAPKTDTKETPKK